MKPRSRPFWSQEFDLLASKFATDSLSEKEHQKLLALLKEDAIFREQFCDWIKSFRDPHPKAFHNRGRLHE